MKMKYLWKQQVMMFSFTEPAAAQDSKTCGYSTDANLSAQVLELLSN